jgi:hypothetical protein
MLIEVMGITYRLRIIRWYQKNIERKSTIQTNTENLKRIIS